MQKIFQECTHNKYYHTHIQHKECYQSFKALEHTHQNISAYISGPKALFFKGATFCKLAGSEFHSRNKLSLAFNCTQTRQK